MTKSTMHSVIGTGSWARLFEFNRDKASFHEEYDGAYVIDVTLEQDQLDIVSNSGSRINPRVGEDGVFVKFKRRHLHPSIPALGGPPKVVDQDDQPWNPEVLIGNGSKVEVFFTVYETSKGKGTRLEGVRVLDLVEYEREDTGDGDSRLPF